MMYADEREIDTLLREISDAVGAAVDREEPTPFAVPPRRGAVRFAACALAVVAVGAGAVRLDHAGEEGGSVADDVGLVCPAEPEPELLTSLREMEVDPAREDSAGMTTLKDEVATGYLKVRQRDVLGRVGVETIFDDAPVATKCDLGPVRALDSDEVIAYFAPNIGVVTLDEYDALETDADVAALAAAAELEAARPCPDEPPC